MRLTINFNWPTGTNAAQISLGQPNTKDKELEFRIGAKIEAQGKGIYWLKDWFPGENDQEISFSLTHGDEIILERRKKGSAKAETRNYWNVTKEWPPEAQGASLTTINWYI